MNVAELERLVINLNSEFDRDKVEAWEYFCDIAPSLVRRSIAAERLAQEVRNDLDAWPVTMTSGSPLVEALTAYEATR